MMTISFDITFFDFLENPFLLIGIFFIGFTLLGVSFWYAFFQRKRMESFFKKSLEKRFEKRSSFFLFLKGGIALVSFFLLLLVVWQENVAFIPLQSQIGQNPPFIFLLDTSLSMSIEDAQFRTRLDYSKEVIAELVKNFPENEKALYAFNSQLISVSPLTLDPMFILSSLKKVDFNEGESEGTDLVVVLNALREKLNQEALKKSYLFIFSDGGDLPLEKGDKHKKEMREKEIVAAWQKLPPSIIPILVGVGGKEAKKVEGVTYNGKEVFSALNNPLITALEKNPPFSHGVKTYFSGNLSPDALVETITPFIKSPSLKTETSQESSFTFFGKREKEFDILIAGVLFLLLFLFFGPETPLKKGKFFKNLLIFLMISFVVEGKESSPLSFFQKEKEAVTYFELQNFEASEEIYAGLLEEVSSLEKEAILNYNRALLLYLQKKYEQAYFLIESLPKERNISLKFEEDLKYLRKKIAYSSFKEQQDLQWLLRGLRETSDPLSLIDKKLFLEMPDTPFFKFEETNMLWVEGQVQFLLDVLFEMKGTLFTKEEEEWLASCFTKAYKSTLPYLGEDFIKKGLVLLYKKDWNTLQLHFKEGALLLEKNIFQKVNPLSLEKRGAVFEELAQFYFLDGVAFKERYNPLLWKRLMTWEKIFDKKGDKIFKEALFFETQDNKEGFLISYLALLEGLLIQDLQLKKSLSDLLHRISLIGFSPPPSFFTSPLFEAYMKKERELFLKIKKDLYEAVIDFHKKNETNPPAIEAIVASFDKAFSFLEGEKGGERELMRRKAFSFFLEAYMDLDKPGKKMESYEDQKKERDLEKIEALDKPKREKTTSSNNVGEKAW